ncbi:MAG: AbrB/MazE/SpoVT family DNA-binding domain-containing protein [Nitrospirae bacterium]|nr:AbrB/MazE/SpoVT family DNA-binding domain-containing protein [Nitrospirota bacterium]
MMASRVSSKGQVTIPREIRDVLGVAQGDSLTYEVRDGVVILKRMEPFDATFHKALSDTLDEWNTPEDEEAFRGL